MKKKEEYELLEIELDKIKYDLKIDKQKLRILEKQKKELTRRQRTHRLCNHGGLLECFLPPDQFTDEQMSTILKELFRKPETQELIVQIKNETKLGESLD